MAEFEIASPADCGRMDLLAPEDLSALQEGLAILGLRKCPANVVWISLGRSHAIDRIVQYTASGNKVIALAGKAQVRARREALSAGLFDFLTTGPIDPNELGARLDLLVHGSALPRRVSLRHQFLYLDGVNHELSQREAEIVALLLEAKGRFVTHERLLRLWGSNADERQYLRVAMRNLRRRIEPEPDLPRYLLSEAAIGYRMGRGIAPASL